MSWTREQAALLRTFLRTGFRRTVLWCGLGMAAAGVLGFAAARIRPGLAEELINAFREQVTQSGVVDEEGAMSVFALLMNNWRAMLLTAMYGFIPFLFLPLISLLVNGALLGVVTAAYHANGMSMALLLAGLLPHGIFELPAMVLSIACGVQLCRNMCLLVTSSPRRVPMVELLGDLLRVMVLLVAPMTVAAALIECYVTPLVMWLFR